jgi:hypothetical protein
MHLALIRLPGAQRFKTLGLLKFCVLNFFVKKQISGRDQWSVDVTGLAVFFDAGGKEEVRRGKGRCHHPRSTAAIARRRRALLAATAPA